MTRTLRNALRAALAGATPGPWQVVEQRYPWTLPAGERRREKKGEHVERLIATVWHHPQAHAPSHVVATAIGVGTKGWVVPVHFTSIREADARFIALCSPDVIGALLDRLDELEAAAGAEGPNVQS